MPALKGQTNPFSKGDLSRPPRRILSLDKFRINPGLVPASRPFSARTRFTSASPCATLRRALKSPFLRSGVVYCCCWPRLLHRGPRPRSTPPACHSRAVPPVSDRMRYSIVQERAQASVGTAVFLLLSHTDKNSRTGYSSYYPEPSGYGMKL